MRLRLKPLKIIVLLSLMLSFTLGFSQKVETKTLPYENEQIGLLKTGKIIKKIYITKPHDNYYKIARKHRLSAIYLMSLNNTKSPYLIIKEPVIIKSFIEPASSENGLIINLPEKKLYRFSDGKLLNTYGVAVGLPTWQTPLGKFSILYKTEAPAWHVPVSIQKEMEEKGEEVKTIVPAGPGNPLGNWWMAIGNGIGIHSTNAPASIGYSVSHGCLRMKPKSAEELFKKVKVKTPVKVIYQPVKIGVDDFKNVYLEAYRNIYSRKINYKEITNMLLKQSNLEENINWDIASRVLRARKGIPVLISKEIRTKIPFPTPTITPSVLPTKDPMINPYEMPTTVPTGSPSLPAPSLHPTFSPTAKPIDIIVIPRPTATVSVSPTPVPVIPTVMPGEELKTPVPIAPSPTPLYPKKINDTTHPR